MTDESHKPFDLQAEILGRLEICARKFRDRPTQKYLEEVGAEMSKRLKLPEVDKYLTDLHLRHERFPALFHMQAALKQIEKERWRSSNPEGTTVVKKKDWASSKAPGTPAIAETLFGFIRDGKTGDGAFRIARRVYAHLSDDELWVCYDAWVGGNVHPMLSKDYKLKTENGHDDFFGEGKG